MSDWVSIANRAAELATATVERENQGSHRITAPSSATAKRAAARFGVDRSQLSSGVMRMHLIPRLSQLRFRAFCALVAGAVSPLAAACHRAVPRTSTAPTEHAEREVLAAVVAWAGRNAKVVVVADSTHLDEHVVARDPTAKPALWSTVERHLGMLPPSLRDDFLRINARAQILRGWLPLPRGWLYAGAPGADSALYRGTSDPGLWGTKGDGGRVLIVPSRPGITSDGRTALLLVWTRCGGRCGWANLVLLRREGTAWRVEDHVEVAVS